MREWIQLDIDERKGKVELIRAVDVSDALRKAAEERKTIGKGFSKKRTLRKVASIPIDVLLSLHPQRAIAILHDDKELRRFLKEHPEFRCSEGGI